jgi:hypothetical protein
MEGRGSGVIYPKPICVGYDRKYSATLNTTLCFTVRAFVWFCLKFITLHNIRVAATLTPAIVFAKENPWPYGFRL